MLKTFGAYPYGLHSVVHLSKVKSRAKLFTKVKRTSLLRWNVKNAENFCSQP
jgi:hypothetical protein